MGEATSCDAAMTIPTALRASAACPRALPDHVAAPSALSWARRFAAARSCAARHAACATWRLRLGLGGAVAAAVSHMTDATLATSSLAASSPAAGGGNACTTADLAGDGLPVRGDWRRMTRSRAIWRARSI